MDWFLILIIFGILLLAASIFANIRMYLKLLKYETRIVSIYDDLVNIMKLMSDIDNKEIFETDDEVGLVFVKLRDTINILEKYVELEK